MFIRGENLLLMCILCLRTFVNAKESNETKVLKEIFGEKYVSIGQDGDAGNFTTDELKRHSSVLANRFRKKYTGKDYSKWKELHEARAANLTRLCYEDAIATFGNVTCTMRLTTEAAANFRVPFNVIGFSKIEVDTLTCAGKFIDDEGKPRAKLSYYFCEGDEPGTAFRFTLAKKSFILTNLIHNIWTIPVRKDKSMPAFINAVPL